MKNKKTIILSIIILVFIFVSIWLANKYNEGKIKSGPISQPSNSEQRMEKSPKEDIEYLAVIQKIEGKTIHTRLIYRKTSEEKKEVDFSVTDQTKIFKQNENGQENSIAQISDLKELLPVKIKAKEIVSGNVIEADEIIILPDQKREINPAPMVKPEENKD